MTTGINGSSEGREHLRHLWSRRKEPVSQVRERYMTTQLFPKQSRARNTPLQQETAIGVNRNTWGRQGGHFTKKGRRV